MILPTPEQFPFALENLKSDSSYYRPIKANHPNYECCFLVLHPFYKLKQGAPYIAHSGLRNKKEVLNQYYEILSWTQFLKLSGIADYKQLDRALIFKEGAMQYGDKEVLDKFAFVVGDQVAIEEARGDYFPVILEDRLLKWLTKRGYDSVYISQYGNGKALLNIDSLIIGDGFFSNNQIETTDGRLLLVTDFDHFHTCFFGSEADVRSAINELDLEGFFCDEYTTDDWSHYEIVDENKVDYHDVFPNAK